MSKTIRLTLLMCLFSLSSFAKVETCDGLVRLVGPPDGKTTMVRSNLLVDPDAESVQLQFKDPDDGVMFTAAEGKLIQIRLKRRKWRFKPWGS